MAEIKIYFSIIGSDLPFHTVTDSLGIAPTDTKRKENWPLPSIIAGVAEDTWTFSLESEENYGISQPIQKLSRLFLPKTPVVRQVCERFHAAVHIEVVIHTDENDLPEMLLSAENIHFLDELHAEVGFDVYFDLT